MTMQKLTQLIWLKKEIELDERRLRMLEAQENRGDPELTALAAAVREKRELCRREQVALEQYILQIDDSFTRQLFVYRYMYGMNWVQVAFAVGGGNTPDAVKKRCQRWVWAHP